MNAETKPPQVPGFGTEEEREENKKAGFIASLLGKLGLGGAGSEGAAYSAATVGASPAVGAGLLASKVGITALILAGTTVAGGLYVGMGGMEGIERMASGSDARNPAETGLAFEQASGQKAADTSAGKSAGASNPTSLDYAAQAGRQAIGDSNKASPSAAGAGSASSAQMPPPDLSTPASSSPAGPKPALVAASGLSSSNSSSSGGAVARLAPQGGLSSGIGGDFQGVYRPAMSQSSPSAGKSTYGVGSRAMVGSGGVKGAMAQLGMTNRVVGANARGADVSPIGSGATYDGGSQAHGNAAATAAAPDGGIGTGGSGISSTPGKVNPATSTNQSQVPTPAVGAGSNKTPWQWAQNVAMGAMALALIALVAMEMFKKSQKYQYAKIAAGIAAMAAAVATAMGITMLASYGQTTQGLLWTGIGGIVTAIAAYKWWNMADDAVAESKAQVGGLTKNASEAVNEQLSAHTGGQATQIGKNILISGSDGNVVNSLDAASGKIVPLNSGSSSVVSQKITDVIMAGTTPAK